MVLDDQGSLPRWLTQSFLEGLLLENNKSGSSVKFLDMSLASAQGDNYLGWLYRITVECNSKRKSLIVKVMPSENNGFEYVSNFGVFRRELSVYQKTLPSLYCLMAQKLGKVKYFSPYCYASGRKDAIVLEDLTPLGYKMADRKAQLDMDHALLVVSALAKLHAFSYALGPDNISHYHEIFFSEENRHLSHGIFTSVFKSLCRAVSQWPGYEKYASALWRLSERAVDSFIEAVKPRRGEFCVLNHGDCWTNNFLFRYSAGTGAVQDVKLIDFQEARFCSPAVDLIYLFYSSLRLDVWRRQDELLRHYHGELTRWLRSAGCNDNVYTFQDLIGGMKSKLCFALAAVSTVCAVALAEPSDAPDVEKLFHEDSVSQISEFHKAHGTEKYRHNVQHFLVYFHEQGLLS